MSLDLKNKKILFIGPIFYDYQNMIKSKLESYGAEVFFFGERDYTFKFKIVYNFFNKKIDSFQEKHYENILHAVDGTTFDFLFVIRGYKIPINFIKKFKELNPKSKTIMYQWDSEKNNKFVHLVPYFDVLFSFDKNDVIKNPRLNYLPLFYADDIENLSSNDFIPQIKYDIFFFGYYLPERYEMMLSILEFSKNNNINSKIFLYIPFTRYVKEILKGNKINFKLISFRPLKRKEYLLFLMESNTIFDSSSISQSGLSMRIMEAIGAKKKIITSNIFIKNESIYNVEQVFVVNPNELERIMPFLSVNSNYYSLGHSLGDWLTTIFNKVN